MRLIGRIATLSLALAMCGGLIGCADDDTTTTETTEEEGGEAAEEEGGEAAEEEGGEAAEEEGGEAAEEEGGEAAEEEGGEAAEEEGGEAAEEEGGEAAEMMNIVDTAVAAGTFETLVAAVTAAGLADTLADESAEFTVFAPTDEAFAALPEGTVEALLEDIPALTAILTYHAIPGKVAAADVVELTEATMLNGATVTIEVTDDGVVLNGSVNVITTDIMCTNGIIHVIDAVLLPPEGEEEGGETAEEEGGETAEEEGGEAVEEEGGEAVEEEGGEAVEEEGGEAVEEEGGEAAEMMNIVDTAIAAGSFETLVAAVTAADLAGTLADEEAEFTVFAPTDDAFDALPEGTVEGLLEDIPALTDILLYHVVAGKVPAADVLGLTSAATLQGTDVSIEVVDGGVVLNGTVNVVTTDIMCTNGIIHVIDAVLIPAE